MMLITDEKTYNELIDYLLSKQDIEYRKFHEKLLRTNYELIGVRSPILQSIAKEIYNSGYENFFYLCKFRYYEEVMIYGLIISMIKDRELSFSRFLDFTKYIDSWAICDSVCTRLKYIEKEKDKYFKDIKTLIFSNEEMKVRVAVILFMCFYICDEYIDIILEIIEKIESDKYYINMGIAWFYSVAFIKYRNKTLDVLKKKKLSKFIQNKAIQKIRESFRVDNEIKDFLLRYKL